jgi:miniconductance mechanosensitive channel
MKDTIAVKYEAAPQMQAQIKASMADQGVVDSLKTPLKDSLSMEYEAFLSFRDQLKASMVQQGMNNTMADIINVLVLTVAVIFLAWLLKFITQRIFITSLERIIKKSKTTYDDYIIERKVLHRAAHMVPAMVIYAFGDIVFMGYPTLLAFVINTSQLYILFAFLWTIGSILNVLEDIYNEFPNAKERPIKGYMQVVNIIVWFIGTLIAVSILFDVQLTAVFASLGAVAAVLLLIFKDTILGLVAGIQLSANKLIKIGDWISMPSHNADGTVIEITLNTVKVLNGDKTIASIPTYNLVSGSFLNHKGLEESGARRIKRFVNIDVNTVSFCNSDMLAKLRQLPLLTTYIDDQEKTPQTEIEAIENRPTNLGLFMKYLELYLKANPKIRQDLTVVVRQLQPTQNGIPVEVYAYSADVALPLYETLQGNIFNHIYATVDVFGLKLFQTPSGNDFAKLVK